MLRFRVLDYTLFVDLMNKDHLNDCYWGHMRRFPTLHTDEARLLGHPVNMPHYYTPPATQFVDDAVVMENISNDE